MAGSWGEQLLQNAAATGAAFDCPGGLCAVVCVATAFNGATIKLQMLAPDGATWLDVSAAQTNFAANGNGLVYLPPCQVRATVTGGPPTAAWMTISRVIG